MQNLLVLNVTEISSFPRFELSVFPSDHIAEKLLEKQSEARMAEWEIQQHSFTKQLAREKHVSNGRRHMGRNPGSRT